MTITDRLNPGGGADNSAQSTHPHAGLPFNTLKQAVRRGIEDDVAAVIDFAARLVHRGCHLIRRVSRNILVKRGCVKLAPREPPQPG